MARPARNWLPTGCEQVFPVITLSVVETRTTSTPPASPSTAKRWVNADLIPVTDYYVEPEREERKFSWADMMPAWHQWARCRTTANPDQIFFGDKEDDEDDHHASLTITQIREVKEFCKGCPVFEECMTHALTTPERHGIWAGTSKRTRLRIIRMMDEGIVTIEEVIVDFLEGRERKYESSRS